MTPPPEPTDPPEPAESPGGRRRWKPGQPLRLETANFFLRSLSEADIDERYLGWMADPELMENLSMPLGMGLPQVRALLRNYDNRNNFHLGIYDRRTGVLVGVYYVFCEHFKRLARSGVLIGDRAYWGGMVVRETRAALLDFLFLGLGIERVWGWVNVRNIPAVFNYKAQGFTNEGVLRGHGRKADGSRVDQFVFGLLRDEWLARRQSQSG